MSSSSQALHDVLARPHSPLQWDARVRRQERQLPLGGDHAFQLAVRIEVQAIVVQQRDINARRAAEVERKEHAEALARSNLRLEEFAYTAAHDLREPLRAISLYTKMLTQNTQMDANAKQTGQNS